jgi:hypothetical protein
VDRLVKRRTGFRLITSGTGRGRRTWLTVPFATWEAHVKSESAVRLFLTIGAATLIAGCGGVQSSTGLPGPVNAITRGYVLCEDYD